MGTSAIFAGGRSATILDEADEAYIPFSSVDPTGASSNRTAGAGAWYGTPDKIDMRRT